MPMTMGNPSPVQNPMQTPTHNVSQLRSPNLNMSLGDESGGFFANMKERDDYNYKLQNGLFPVISGKGIGATALGLNTGGEFAGDTNSIQSVASKKNGTQKFSHLTIVPPATPAHEHSSI